MTGPSRDDDRPAAVRNAEASAQSWQAAVRAQRHADLDHADFYALAADLTDTLASLGVLVEVLAGQAARYADAVVGSGGTVYPGGAVYDDTRTGDPRVRLAAAVDALRAAAGPLAAAQRHANAFWSAIGHIGVEHVEGRGDAGGVR